MFLRFEEIWCWSWICHGCSFFLFSSLQLLAAHHLRFKWDSNLQPFGVLHGGMTAYIAESLASMGAQIASNWSRVAGIEMNVTHLQAASNGHKVMVKALPMRVGKRVQVWEILLPLLLLYGDGILLYSRHTFTSLVWTTSSFFWRVVKSTQCSKYWTSTRVKWQPTAEWGQDEISRWSWEIVQTFTSWHFWRTCSQHITYVWNLLTKSSQTIIADKVIHQGKNSLSRVLFDLVSHLLKKSVKRRRVSYGAWIPDLGLQFWWAFILCIQILVDNTVATRSVRWQCAWCLGIVFTGLECDIFNGEESNPTFHRTTGNCDHLSCTGHSFGGLARSRKSQGWNWSISCCC